MIILIVDIYGILAAESKRDTPISADAEASPA
jgi:hypothetical protein